MKEGVSVSGVVLLAQPVGDFDKRLVILTRELGRITVFARGARRQNSAFLAAANPFVFAQFTLSEGREAYSLMAADVVSYFTELAAMQPGAFYGFYFLELASYFGREGMEAGETVNLLYVSLKAILKEKMPLPLLRRVYELRTLAINGEFRYPEEGGGHIPAARYALTFCAGCALPKLYSFLLEEDAEKDFIHYVRQEMKRAVDRPFRTLRIIDEIG